MFEKLERSGNQEFASRGLSGLGMPFGRVSPGNLFVRLSGSFNKHESLVVVVLNTVLWRRRNPPCLLSMIPSLLSGYTSKLGDASLLKSLSQTTLSLANTASPKAISIARSSPTTSCFEQRLDVFLGRLISELRPTSLVFGELRLREVS